MSGSLSTPDVQVLSTSGYTDGGIMHDGLSEPGVRLLRKPYKREAPARKVR